MWAYEKLGSCALLAAMIEPLTGRRLAQVHPQSTKREYTLFLSGGGSAVSGCHQNQDNLSTHDACAFYENLSTDEDLALAERFEFSTPKSVVGSA